MRAVNSGVSVMREIRAPMRSFDAKDWARAFCAQVGGDEHEMVRWFACALTAGFNEGVAYSERRAREIERRRRYEGAA